MKKLVMLVSVVLTLCVLFCACGKDTNAKPLSDVFSDIKTAYSVTDLVEFGDVSDLDRFYGIAAEDAVEFAGGINNSGVNQEEIVMILAPDADAAARVEQALDNRLSAKLNETKSYNPEQYAILEQCSVDIDGSYVTMFLSADADGMKETFRSAVGV